MIDVLVNGRWPLKMLDHREEQWAHPWEEERLASMFDLLSPGDVIVDVGAEQGDMPALFASWGCQVILVEPRVAVWPNMKATFDMNGLAPPVWSWVGFAGDEMAGPPHGTVWAGWPDSAAGPITRTHAFHHLSQEGDAIPQITLDVLCAQANSVAAITLDVEGSELAVLRGAVNLLTEQRPLVWCSLHGDAQWMVEQYPDGTAEHVDAFMADLGYTKTVLSVQHETHALYTPKERP